MWTGECSLKSVPDKETDVCSVLKMRWFIRGGTKTRELELAIMEQGNLLL
jgi:hypothetical protein